VDCWVLKLHHFQRYKVKSVYTKLIDVEVHFNVGYKHVLWVKAVPLIKLTFSHGVCF